jgi:hypothetical protein
MRFPIADLIDEIKCYNYLLNILHPDGLKCPNGHPLPQNQAPHDTCRSPIMDINAKFVVGFITCSLTQYVNNKT